MRRSNGDAAIRAIASRWSDNSNPPISPSSSSLAHNIDRFLVLLLFVLGKVVLAGRLLLLFLPLGSPLLLLGLLGLVVLVLLLGGLRGSLLELGLGGILFLSVGLLRLLTTHSGSCRLLVLLRLRLGGLVFGGLLCLLALVLSSLLLLLSLLGGLVLGLLLGSGLGDLLSTLLGSNALLVGLHLRLGHAVFCLLLESLLLVLLDLGLGSLLLLGSCLS